MAYNGKLVCLEEVIITHLERRGEGVGDDPIRRILQIWTKDGDLIAEVDPCKEE